MYTQHKQMAELRRLAASDAAKLKELASLPMSLQEARTAKEAAEALVEEHEATVRVGVQCVVACLRRTRWTCACLPYGHSCTDRVVVIHHHR